MTTPATDEALLQQEVESGIWELEHDEGPNGHAPLLHRLNEIRLSQSTELATLRAELARSRELIAKFASQPTPEEIPLDLIDGADFEGAYKLMIDKARDFLSSQEKSND